jgi:hypothetical protein
MRLSAGHIVKAIPLIAMIKSYTGYAHSYGPRYQMSLENSALEMSTSQEFIEKFAYPLVVAANPDEFYTIQGDTIDYVYALWQKRIPLKSSVRHLF